MWHKEINNNSELNKKKKVGDCTDYLLIFIDFSCCLYWKIEKFCNFASEFISQLRKGNRRTQAIDALRLLLLQVFLNSPFPFLCHLIASFIFSLHIVCGEKIIFVHIVIFSLFEMISNPMKPYWAWRVIFSLPRCFICNDSCQVSEETFHCIFALCRSRSEFRWTA